jgi:hypothetical protein
MGGVTVRDVDVSVLRFSPAEQGRLVAVCDFVDIVKGFVSGALHRQTPFCSACGSESSDTLWDSGYKSDTGLVLEV